MRLLAMLGEDSGGVPQEYREPEVPSLEPSGFAREPSLRLPGPSRWQNALDAMAAQVASSQPQLRRNAPQLQQALAGLLSGGAGAYSRSRLTDAAERELFNRSQAAQTQARVTARDASFKDARGKAEAVKRDRIAQMRRAIERYEEEADRADNNARNAIDEGSRSSFTAKRDRALAQIERIEPDLARLEGRSATARMAPAEITPKVKTGRTGPRPKETPPAEKRRSMVAGIIADLTRRGMGDRAGIQSYMAQKGVVDTLAAHGITPAELLRAVPE